MKDTLYIEFVGNIKDFDKVILPHITGEIVFPEWYDENIPAHFILNSVRKELRINQKDNIFYIEL